MEIRKSEIANEVARLCKERGITQYELAKRSQLQESSVRNMFQKGTTPTYRTPVRYLRRTWHHSSPVFHRFFFS